MAEQPQPEEVNCPPAPQVLVEYRHPPYPRLIQNIVCRLERTVQLGDTSPEFGDLRYKTFVSRHLPFIDLRWYLEHIFRYSGCSPDCFVYAYIYLERFNHLYPIHTLNIHRLLLTSIVVAVKIVNGRIHSNAYFADVGGVGRMRMNKMELRFLFDLDFKLYVNANEFSRYSSMLEG